MPLFRNHMSRRRELRRDLLPPSHNWVAWWTHRQNWWTLGYILLLAVAGAVIALIGRGASQYQVDQVVTEPIVSRVEFQSVDPVATLERRRRAQDRHASYYVPNIEYFQQVLDRLHALGSIGLDDNVPDFESIPEATRQSLHLSPKAFSELRRYVTAASSIPWDRLILDFMANFMGIAVISNERATIEKNNNEDLANEIMIKHPDLEDTIREDRFLFNVAEDLEPIRKNVNLILTNRLADYPNLKTTFVELVLDNPQPTYLYDEQETRRRKLERFNDPANEARIGIEVGTVLVGEGRVLSSLDAQLIAEERQAYCRSLGWKLTYLIRPAYVAVFFVLGLGVWTYLSVYYKRVARNPLRGGTITGLLLLSQLLAVAATVAQPRFVYITAVLPCVLTAMILAVSYDRRLALALGAIHALAVVVSLDLPAGLFVVMMCGVAVAAGQLMDVRSRSKLVVVGLWCGLAMGLTTIAVGLASRPVHLEGETVRILVDAMCVAVTGFVCGILIQGVLPGIEKVFSVTTSMTLKELIDASHPLLRRLAQDAPGTYQHSLRISDMAEAAADTIGADGLLCKVGAMYHDIGKVNKPLYFVENQGSGPNRHSRLSPAMSVLVIVGHVKDGMELAREYNLPRVLRHFIESHHGTTLVEYFYEAAKQQCGAENRPAPSEFEFRYPGPKPQTKEAAILMLCDVVEGAARTLDDPNPSRIEQLVHAMASKRLTDGQFDECSLTLQELHKIEQAIMKVVCAIYHGRIKYPGDKAHQQPDTPQRSQRHG